MTLLKLLFTGYSAGWVHADEGVFSGLHHVRLEVWSRAEGQQKVKAAGKELTVSRNIFKIHFSEILHYLLFDYGYRSSYIKFCSVLYACFVFSPNFNDFLSAVNLLEEIYI